MTYGIVSYNDALQAQMYPSRPVPEFVGKIITGDDNIVAYQGAEFGQATRSFSGIAPDSGGRSVIVFWTLPENTQWLLPSVPEPASSSGERRGLFAFGNPASPIVGAPVGYVFALTPSYSSEQFGARTWDENGNLVFDSGHSHLSIHQIANVSPYSSGNDNSVSYPRTLPAKPAFMGPHVFRTINEYDGSESNLAHIQQWISTLKVSGSSLQARFPLVQDEMYPNAITGRQGYHYDTTSGNASGLIMPIIDASLYD